MNIDIQRTFCFATIALLSVMLIACDDGEDGGDVIAGMSTGGTTVGGETAGDTAGDTAGMQMASPITLTAEEIASLPTQELQEGVNQGELTAYMLRVEIDLTSAYAREAQEALFIFGAFADDEADPTEAFAALAADRVCCDRVKWISRQVLDNDPTLSQEDVDGRVDEADWTACNEARYNYLCTSDEETDCYRWGSKNELFTDHVEDLIGYSQAAQKVPCEAVRMKFDDVVVEINAFLADEVGTSHTQFASAMNGFISTLKKPAMNAIVLVDSENAIAFMRFESFNVPFEGMDKKFVPDPKPYVSEEVMSLPIGSFSYKVMNEDILPTLGFENGVAGIFTRAIASKICGILPLGVSICVDAVEEFATETVSAGFSSLAERVSVDVANFVFETFSTSGGQFTLSTAVFDAGTTMTAEYEVVSR